jgi:hypothetical protein
METGIEWLGLILMHAYQNNILHVGQKLMGINIVTCRMVRVMRMTGSSLDDWIY